MLNPTVQVFRLESPSWLKYLQIHQLSHYGTESVCALNDVTVFGKSAAEDLEDRLSQEASTEAAEQSALLLEEGTKDLDESSNLSSPPPPLDPNGRGRVVADGSLHSPTNSQDGGQKVAAEHLAMLLADDNIAKARSVPHLDLDLNACCAIMQ